MYRVSEVHKLATSFFHAITDIVNYIYEHPTALDLRMKGFWISDRKLSLMP